MSMSLKAELEAWANALSAYEAEDFSKALELFEPIADTSRILTNIGLILATLGEHERAIENFQQATELDNYLAIAYFQAGVSFFLLTRYEEAFEQFEIALMWLRGNQAINYEQLGLDFRLYMAEILFNRGLCLLNLGRVPEGLADLENAQKDKVTPEHDVIDEAIYEGGNGYTVFSIPVGVLFRPNPNKIKNLQTKDYLGKARLISKDGTGYQAFDGVDPSELAFRPEERRNQGANLGRSSSDIGGTSAPKNPAGLSRAATSIAVTTRPTVDAPRRPAGGNPGQSRPSMENASGRPSMDNGTGRPSADFARRPSVDVLSNRPSLEGSRPLGRANTTIRPVRPASPPKEPLRPIDSRAAMSRSPEPVMVRSPEPMAPGPNPARGLSVRRPALKPASGGAVDSIYDSYSSPQPAAGGLQRAGTIRAEEWNASVARAPSRSEISRAPSRSQGSLGRSASQYTVRRAPSRKGTIKARSIRSYEEEEGYESGGGEPEEVSYEPTKILVRLHFNDTLRGMAIMPDISSDDFIEKVCSKFGKEYGDLVIKFKDGDGARVTLIDESDFELAIEGIKNSKEPRLEIWCELPQTA